MEVMVDGGDGANGVMHRGESGIRKMFTEKQLNALFN